jgi:membrane protease YdiL (CAAX protease family)
MSVVRASGVPARGTPRDATALVVPALGFVALLVRVLLIGSPAATPLFIAIMVFLGLISIATPLAATPSPLLSRASVLIVGVVAVGATLALPRAAPLAHTPLIVAMSIGAAISEEVFFRRLVYGTLVRWGVGVAIVGSAVSFAAVHIPLYGPAVFWVDLGAGLLFGWQRWASGNWHSSAATHALANLAAVIR